MDGFLPELKAQIEGRGVKTRTFQGTLPKDCKYRLEYTANWHWDMAMYLTYADLIVYENGRLIGQATYDARWGGGRPDKFGPTASKLRGLTDSLFRQSGLVQEGKSEGAQAQAGQ